MAARNFKIIRGTEQIDVEVLLIFLKIKTFTMKTSN